MLGATYPPAGTQVPGGGFLGTEAGGTAWSGHSRSCRAEVGETKAPVPECLVAGCSGQRSRLLNS